MANSKIKTRILLRNDTLANWEKSALTLAKGEVAIATGADGKVAEIRVGTGSSTWAQALKLTVASDQVTGLKEYRTAADGKNKWNLQVKGIGEADTAWSTVSTIDMTALSAYALSADVTKAVGNALTEAKGYTDTEAGKLVSKADFNTLSTAIGLDQASSANKVVTQKDIATLDNVMHFGGVVTGEPTTEGKTDADVGTVVVDVASGKEYVLIKATDGLKWEVIGDQNTYATKTALTNLENTLTGQIDGIQSDVTFLSGKIDDINDAGYALSADVDTKVTAEIGKLDVAKTENGNEKAGFVQYVTEADGKISVEKKAITTSDVTDIDTFKSGIIGTTSDLSSAATVNGAKKYAQQYADEKVKGLTDSFLILDCGSSALRDGEPTAADLNA